MAEAWRNWSQSLSCQPAEFKKPATVAEVQEAVREAAAAGHRLRVVGSGHSFSPIVPTDGVLLDLGGLAGVHKADRERRRAVIAAGTRIADLGVPLARLGLGLRNQGDIDKQTLAGAISTGTHGTGVTLGNLSSFVVGLQLVTAKGEILEVTSREPDMLDAARISLGMLGVVTAVSLDLDPAYSLVEQAWDARVPEVFERLDVLTATHRHFEFFWQPERDLCECKALDAVEPERAAVPEGGRIGRSYQIFPSERRRLFNEMEFSVPAAAGPACFHEIRSLIQSRHREVYFPVEYRTVAPDGIWLSPQYGRPSVAISVHQAAHLPYEAFFRDCEAVFRAHGGRPHLGKLHGFGAADFRRTLPRFDDFLALRRRLDPDGIFLNDHLAAIFGPKPAATRAA
jgi:FAD/FMN-containing dehydrogenase